MRGDWDRDREHLNLLGIFHYVVAGILLCPCAYGLAYAGMGGLFSSMAQELGQQTPNAPPEELVESMGMFVSIFGGGISLASLTLMGCGVYAGYCLQKQKKRVFCVVTAALLLLFIPLGTILGVFTLIVLGRPTVLDLFEGRSPADAFDDDDPDRRGYRERR